MRRNRKRGEKGVFASWKKWRQWQPATERKDKCIGRRKLKEEMSTRLKRKEEMGGR